MISGHVDTIYAAAAQGVCCVTLAHANLEMIFVFAMIAAVLQEFAVSGDIAAVPLLQLPTVNEQPSPQSFEQQVVLKWGSIGAVRRTLCPREHRNLFKSFGPSGWFLQMVFLSKTF